MASLLRCPVQEIAEIVEPLRELNEETFFTEFKTFRFGNQTTVFAHCSVQVCLDKDECEKVNVANIQTKIINLTPE